MKSCHKEFLLPLSVFLFTLNFGNEGRLTMRLHENVTSTKLPGIRENASFELDRDYFTGYGNMVGSLDVMSGFVSR